MSRYSAMAAAATIALIVVAVSAPIPQAEDQAMEHSAVQIPGSIRAEHAEIHSTLIEATKEPGRVGAAAKELAEVLHPHFVREEEIALPPLGLLAPLASNVAISRDQLDAVLKMTDALRSELSGMLEEHKQIRAAVEKLRGAARAEKSAKYEKLADQLALHAQTEEEVLYPTAILVGDIIRARQTR